ncbi:uncharacterized protein V1510DRAFT_411636 [Dipodascopsis tothii]|uniref:uncharacterized protein n=1 Tax=Dipodascopsis tothii TaxID=44089 RepID=UPI0034CDAD06
MSAALAYLGKEKDLNTQVESFIAQLKRRQIKSSYGIALATAQLLLRVVSAARWTQIEQLIVQIKELGARLEKAQPRELTCGNIVRRVLAIIREENEDTGMSEFDDDKGNGSPLIASMFSLLSTDDKEPAEAGERGERGERGELPRKKDLKPYIIEGIQELIDEIKNIEESIAGMGVEMIHENETLLTPTPSSRTVLKFLLRAAQKRKFSVLVTESFPNEVEVAHGFAKQLAQAGIETTVISDATAYSIMGRVGKVVLGASSVVANGGFIASAGASAVCECASVHKTPVVVCTGIYKLSPMYPFDREGLVEVGDAGKVLEFENGPLIDKVNVVNPLFDYVPPELVDLYITNLGGYSPSFVYRLVLDYYRQDDVIL